MSRKSIRLQIISLDKEIKDLESREMDACYASATQKPHEDFAALFQQKDRLMTIKLALQAKLEKPTFIQVITGGGKR